MFAHVHERGHRLCALVPAWIEREDVPLEHALKQPDRDVAVAEDEPAFRVAAGDREVQLLVERPRRLEMAGVYNSPTSVDLPNLANSNYIDRVNRAVDYVTAHLGERIRLEDVADAACFSPFHFHRVFRMLMGETLGAFIKRVRLERAVFLLSHQPGATLTEIALDCGFSSSSDFSRSFRARYGVAPRRFDLESFRRSGAEALRAKLPPADPGGSSNRFVAIVRPQPARHVVYIRVYRPYQADNAPQAIARLLAWAEQRGLADGQWLGYQWDDPEIVPLEKCRYDVGLEVPGDTMADDTVSMTSFDACLVAEVEINGTIDVELRALQWLYGTWLPQSGYVPAHQPAFEAWNGRPFAHGTEFFSLRAQLPVQPAFA